MKRLAGVCWLGALLVAGCATTPGSAQTNDTEPEPPVVASADPEPTGMTIWDGVYTAAQADRGEETAEANCYSCHSESEWSNPTFMRVWNGQPVHGFWDNIRMTMPYDSPGRLTAQEYADIVAKMLELHYVPAGDDELVGSAEALQMIQITPES